MEIKHSILKNYLDDIENNTITLNKIDIFGQSIDLDGLSELFDLIESGELDLHPLKLYSIVYDQKLIAELSSQKTLNFVDMIFAAMWQREIESSTSQDIIEATLGFVLFGTDITKRIRNGYRQLNYDITRFEEQIKDIVFDFNNFINNGTFIKELSRLPDDLKDEQLLKIDSPDLDSVKTIRQRLIFSKIAYQYAEEKDSSISKELLNKATAMNEKEIDYIFLPQQVLNIFNDIRTSKAVLNADTDYIKNDSSFSLKKNIANKEKNFLAVEEDFEDLEVLQDAREDLDDGFVGNIKNIVSTKNKKDKPLNLNSLTMKSNKEKKQSSFKTTIVMVCVIAALGIAFVANTQKEKINKDTTMAEEIINGEIDSANNKFEINRSGTNKVEE